MIKKKTAARIAKEFLDVRNPDRWDEKGEIPESVSFEDTEYVVDDGTKVTLALTKNAWGWAHECEKTGENGTIIYESEGIHTEDDIIKTLLEACGYRYPLQVVTDFAEELDENGYVCQANLEALKNIMEDIEVRK